MNTVIEQPVVFKENKIQLKIPKEGLNLEGGWKIQPLAAPIVSYIQSLQCNYSDFKVIHYHNVLCRFSSHMLTLIDFISSFHFAS